jgi:predicted DNA-binding protein with PD1-like motif
LITKRNGDLLLVRLTHGDDLIESFKAALEKEKVRSGVIIGGVGMLAGAELGYYAGGGRYETFKVDGEVELCALSGNISTFEGEYVIHMHAVGALSGGSTVGGHVISARVHMTNELAVLVSRAGMERKLDKETGLNLLWFEG